MNFWCLPPVDSKEFSVGDITFWQCASDLANLKISKFAISFFKSQITKSTSRSLEAYLKFFQLQNHNFYVSRTFLKFLDCSIPHSMTQIFSKSCNSEAREDISQACEIKILRKVSQIDLKTDFPCQFSVEFFSVNIDFRSTFPDFESTSNQGLIELLTSNQRNFQSRKISCIPLASLRVKHET